MTRGGIDSGIGGDAQRFGYDAAGRTIFQGYARDEHLAGERMADGAQAIAREARKPLIIFVGFDAELTALPKGYLALRATEFDQYGGPHEWSDAGGGAVLDAD